MILLDGHAVQTASLQLSDKFAGTRGAISNREKLKGTL